MHRQQKRLLGQGLLDLALILAVLRNTEFPDLGAHEDVYDRASHQDANWEDGPLIGITSSPVHHFQEHSWFEGSGYSQKSANLHYDNTMDEYEHIMRDLRSRPPVRLHSDRNENNTTRNVITMVISIRDTTITRAGDVQIANSASHFPQGGAVGGTNAGWFDDNFDIFNNFVPSNMGEDEINDLILSTMHENASNTDSNDNSHTDIRWQQFLAGCDVSDGLQGSMVKRSEVDNALWNWGGQDVLNEAILTSELFSNPILNGEQSAEGQSQAMDSDVMLESASLENDDIVSMARLDMIDAHDWNTQNHEEDLLFPSLPPPTYEEVVTAEAAAVNASSSEVNHVQQYNTNHMHDHNYFNSTSSAEVQAQQNSQPIGYAIRARQEISTRVISVPPRPRHISDTPSVGNEAFECASDTSSDIGPPSSRTSTPRRITVGSDSGVEMDNIDSQLEELTNLLPSSSETYDLNDLEIRPLNSSCYQNLSNDVGMLRELIICNS